MKNDVRYQILDVSILVRFCAIFPNWLIEFDYLFPLQANVTSFNNSSLEKKKKKKT